MMHLAQTAYRATAKHPPTSSTAPGQQPEHLPAGSPCGASKNKELRWPLPRCEFSSVNSGALALTVPPQNRPREPQWPARTGAQEACDASCKE